MAKGRESLRSNGELGRQGEHTKRRLEKGQAMAPKARLRTDIGWSAPDSITLFGRDFPSEILGHLSFGDMAFLELTARTPTANESRMFNAMLVTLVEHGLTPSALAARLTYMGAPESIQAAVAAGLCGLGTVFVGSIEGSAKMLYQAMPEPAAGSEYPAIAEQVVAKFNREHAILPGIGHPFHKPIDPRTPRLIALARETGFEGPYVQLIQIIAQEAERIKGRPLPVNATGILGALCCEMGFDWQICRGLGVMARAVGLVGHILEESRRPIAREVVANRRGGDGTHARWPNALGSMTEATLI
ncbi:citryl-CoA lyase [Bradyrhizobium sp. LHD-71]|uniref:citryl-CoA lyase n=1 Tax=Bradyrhizobium sp. LHD-71 TaxID=3072141 RepID=UPI00280FCEA0|nr:citryl-CoA lyase [Bradyrhizobium sp. LHD-71]MDQ8728024.1 citryl-CoA lyase [Bradyrhizobium sp. LHD-71]